MRFQGGLRLKQQRVWLEDPFGLQALLWKEALAKRLLQWKNIIGKRL
ncbi:hypothetical protein [Niastella populi]|nr:hypothetical protein [Niastella populi]